MIYDRRSARIHHRSWLDEAAVTVELSRRSARAYHRNRMCHFGVVSRRRSLTTFAAAIYAFFLITAPFEHHDLLCHLKNPSHCSSCVGNQLGSDPQSLAIPGT